MKLFMHKSEFHDLVFFCWKCFVADENLVFVWMDPIEEN